MDSPRSSDALLSPSTQRTASMMLDLPQPLGPTTPTSWLGVGMEVGSTNDLKPASLIWVKRTGRNQLDMVRFEQARASGGTTRHRATYDTAAPALRSQEGQKTIERQLLVSLGNQAVNSCGIQSSNNPFLTLVRVSQSSPSPGQRGHTHSRRILNKGFYLVMAAQALSSVADNALLIAAIALIADLQGPAWMAPMMKWWFALSYVVLAAF